MRLAAGTTLEVRLPGAQILDDLAQGPGARRASLDQCFEIGDFGRDGLELRVRALCDLRALAAYPTAYQLARSFEGFRTEESVPPGTDLDLTDEQ